MKAKEIKCSNCGANVEIEEGQQVQSCKFCGNKILLNDENNTTTTTNYNHRYIDEARIKEIETEKELKIKAEEHKQKQEADRKRLNLYLLIAWIASMVLFLFISFFTMDSVGFSPLHIFLILDAIIGIIVIVKRSKNNR